MKITCERTFPFKVVGKTALKAYYRAESFDSGSILIDDVGAHNIDFASRNIPAIIPGKIGNALQYLALDSLGYEGDTVIPADPVFDVSDKSWLFRLWLMHTNVSPFDPQAFLFDNDAQITFGFKGDTNQVHLFTEPDSSNDLLSAPLSPFIWHRVIAFGDVAHGILGLKIDNDPTQTSFYTGSRSNLYFSLGMGFSRFNQYNLALDEIGFWKDYVWTAADFTKDWNGGNGITWPEAAEIG